MDDLDQAALRRFDLKVKFDFLKPAQASEMLNCYCLQLGLGLPQSDAVAGLSRLLALTPGGFAAVVRQNRFRPIKTAAALVCALEAECAEKKWQRRALALFTSKPRQFQEVRPSLVRRSARSWCCAHRRLISARRLGPVDP